MLDATLPFLQQLQLTDSLLPIGGQAHSFGLETLAVDRLLDAQSLECFVQDALSETGTVEGYFCWRAYQLAQLDEVDDWAAQWVALNQQMAALRVAREQRTASATLGRRFYSLVSALVQEERLVLAGQVAKQAQVEVYHPTIFGLTGGSLGWQAEATVLAFLQQSVSGWLMACPKLFPVGQSQLVGLLWRLKPLLIETLAHCREAIDRQAIPVSFAPMLELANMRHPRLNSRLFIS